MYPVAAVPNHNKTSGLKDYKYLFFLFWRPEVQNGPRRAEIKVLAGPCAFRRLQERIVSVPFTSPGAACILWLVAPSLHLLSQHLQSLSHALAVLLPFYF